jgi:hypothetical protein
MHVNGNTDEELQGDGRWGTSTPVADAPWESEESKEKLDPNKEVFIGVALEEICDGSF